ncbi:Exodeoxyribonuclease V alpha chain [Candidatus Westeberhardia cardiocondylae]|uniref:RecBCD enzyme subunit RecD n=1 Tax=Candidatus Westeberhardia cardiocondylae TaxID=1594731 RepID=A0A0H5C4T3_9ENTR|nr:exodeoxyribonuclease V subunit alpha [Candidatus Westeberhardia cardiocondylae]CEN31991.1 Exodeoxyribonuclease V alpha chain [Candidatus Westeberhardia cardiocondylae]
MEKFFFAAEELGLCRSLDIFFAKMLTKYLCSTKKEKNALMLASFCVSMYQGKGHVCFPIRFLTPEYIFEGDFLDLSEKMWKKSGVFSIKEWKTVLFSSSIVSNGMDIITPLILDNEKLYLYRIWKNECMVADFFSQSNVMFDFKKKVELSILLNKYFPQNDVCVKFVDWQKVAAAVAVTHRVSLICGGPGTGKTAIIAKLLMILLYFFSPLRIVMSAPTAKAALKMGESLYYFIHTLNLDNEQKKFFPNIGITLHSLFNMKRIFHEKLFYSNINFVDIDVLIIDEISMIDLNMMSIIISSLSSKIRVIFLGDRYQLPAIGIGSVLKDICQIYNFGYSFKRSKELCELTGFDISCNKKKRYFGFSDSICFLQRNYRFDESSGIAKLANYIKNGDYSTVLMLLKNNALKNVHYCFMENLNIYENMLNFSISVYKEYLFRIHKFDDPKIILTLFNKIRLLCVLKKGPFGMFDLNMHLEQLLCKLGFISYQKYGLCDNYIGRPIMILKNTPLLGLYNGDIGIVLSKSLEKEDFEVYFLLSNKKIKKVSYSILPKHETAFVTTVHKSQGLEFDNVILVLPNFVTPLLTRELLYTAVTRSKKCLTIYGTNNILRYAIRRKTVRISGLIERIKKNISFFR